MKPAGLILFCLIFASGIRCAPLQKVGLLNDRNNEYQLAENGRTPDNAQARIQNELMPIPPHPRKSPFIEKLPRPTQQLMNTNEQAPDLDQSINLNQDIEGRLILTIIHPFEVAYPFILNLIAQKSDLFQVMDNREFNKVIRISQKGHTFDVLIFAHLENTFIQTQTRDSLSDQWLRDFQQDIEAALLDAQENAP